MLSIPDSLGQLARQFSRLLGGDGAGILPALALPPAQSGRQQSGGAIQRVAGQAAGSMFGGPLGLIASALASLFSREREAPQLPLFERPQSLALDFDVGQLLEQRMAGKQIEQTASPMGVHDRDRTADPSSTTRDPASPMVTIQVNAMDAQSFADHRDEIASAVRDALSRNHGLRDEIWED